ncbi:MAG TPA: hypothetical protein VKE70_20295 [Candidatus Solibacter sp.]|nr:hypothetical protein [Candidatus Solibacter sp.]
MDPAMIASSVMTILGPYVSQVGEALGKTVGEAAVDKASKLLGWLKQKFEGDPVATADLSRFQENPKTFEKPLQDTIQKKAAADPGFAQEAEKHVAGMGPKLSIFQEIVDGKRVVGVEGNVYRGDVSVNQNVQNADDVTAVKGNVG